HSRLAPFACPFEVERESKINCLRQQPPAIGARVQNLRRRSRGPILFHLPGARQQRLPESVVQLSATLPANDQPFALPKQDKEIQRTGGALSERKWRQGCLQLLDELFTGRVRLAKRLGREGLAAQQRN